MGDNLAPEKWWATNLAVANSRTREQRRQAYFKNPTGEKNLQVTKQCPNCLRKMMVGQLARHKPKCKGLVFCANCGKPRGNNPKFCGQSCSAKHSNKLRGDRRKRPCLQCEAPTSNKKFCSPKCVGEYGRSRSEAKALAGGGGSGARRVLMREQHGRCKICGNNEWLGQPIPLELDHINGNSDDWRMENLRLVCINCHGLTPTYRAKNAGNGRHIRRQRYVDGKSY